MSRRLSPHFSEAEAVATRRYPSLMGEQVAAWRNSKIIQENAERHANEALEPVRAIIGVCPVSGWFRCPKLNLRVGGVSNSLHLIALATDIQPARMGLVEAMVALRSALVEGRLGSVDSIIMELKYLDRWIHVQSARSGKKPRHLALMSFDGATYPPFNAGDPRVARMWLKKAGRTA